MNDTRTTISYVQDCIHRRESWNRLSDGDSDESVKQGFRRILADGPVDVLVNNAGIERTGAIETDYFGAIRCMQAVIRPMQERGNGAIINVTSVAGKISLSPLGPYCATKFGLEALGEALAQRLSAFGLRVAIVEPSIIETQMARDIEEKGVSTIYPQVRRCTALYEGTRKAGAGKPEVVARQLRHPVGPDAQPFLGWRGAMNDEDWVQ